MVGVILKSDFISNFPTMSTTTTVRKKGQITLPVKVREACNIKENDEVRIIPLKNGAALIVPVSDSLELLVDKMSSEARRSGVTLEGMLAELREIRKKS